MQQHVARCRFVFVIGFREGAQKHAAVVIQSELEAAALDVVQGIPDEQAYEWSHSRKGYWRIAGSWVLSTSLTNDFLHKMGWVCLQDAYRMRPAT